MGNGRWIQHFRPDGFVLCGSQSWCGHRINRLPSADWRHGTGQVIVGYAASGHGSSLRWAGTARISVEQHRERPLIDQPQHRNCINRAIEIYLNGLGFDERRFFAALQDDIIDACFARSATGASRQDLGTENKPGKPLMNKKARQQLLTTAILGGVIILAFGVLVGLLIGRGQSNSATVTANNKVGLGVTRQRMIDVLSQPSSGAFDFVFKRGAVFDFYHGSSNEIESVAVALNGPPENLMQIGVAFSLKNIGDRTQFSEVLKSVSVNLANNFDVAKLTGWLDTIDLAIGDKKVTATTVIGNYRFLLHKSGGPPGQRRNVLTIEPAVLVTWSKD